MKTSITTLLLFISAVLFSQVEKTIVVEHFTNTRCGICANKNPGFYENLSTQQGVIHMAVHPSSPYSACLLSQHNPQENDDRTKFYDVYGGTPDFIIQGNVLPSNTNYNDPSMFEPYADQTSPYEMKIKEIRYGDDSVHAVLTLKTVDVAMLQRAKLYMAYVEDTVFYEAPNGETEHYDVFRKAFTPGDGILVFLPSNGDSATINLRLDVNSEWVLNRMSVIAILQDENSKEVLQAGKTTKLEINGPTFIDTRNSLEKTIKAFPNPASNKLYVENVSGKVSLSRIDGRMVRNYYSEQSDQLLEIEVSDLPEGLYVLRSRDASGMVSIKR